MLLYQRKGKKNQILNRTGQDRMGRDGTGQFSRTSALAAGTQQPLGFLAVCSFQGAGPTAALPSPAAVPVPAAICAAPRPKLLGTSSDDSFRISLHNSEFGSGRPFPDIISLEIVSKSDLIKIKNSKKQP